MRASEVRDAGQLLGLLEVVGTHQAQRRQRGVELDLPGRVGVLDKAGDCLGIGQAAAAEQLRLFLTIVVGGQVSDVTYSDA